MVSHRLVIELATHVPERKMCLEKQRRREVSQGALDNLSKSHKYKANHYPLTHQAFLKPFLHVRHWGNKVRSVLLSVQEDQKGKGFPCIAFLLWAWHWDRGFVLNSYNNLLGLCIIIPI
jgi:hypothetical protein